MDEQFFKVETIDFGGNRRTKQEEEKKAGERVLTIILKQCEKAFRKMS